MRGLRSDSVRRLLGCRRNVLHTRLHIHVLLLLVVVSLVRGRVGQSLGFLRSATCGSLLHHFPLSCLDGQIMVMVMVLVILVATLVETSLVHATLLH